MRHANSHKDTPKSQGNLWLQSDRNTKLSKHVAPESEHNHERGHVQ